jgi:hypothetical protein
MSSLKNMPTTGKITAKVGDNYDLPPISRAVKRL